MPSSDMILRFHCHISCCSNRRPDMHAHTRHSDPYALQLKTKQVHDLLLRATHGLLRRVGTSDSWHTHCALTINATDAMKHCLLQEIPPQLQQTQPHSPTKSAIVPPSRPPALKVLRSSTSGLVLAVACPAASWPQRWPHPAWRLRHHRPSNDFSCPFALSFLFSCGGIVKTSRSLARSFTTCSTGRWPHFRGPSCLACVWSRIKQMATHSIHPMEQRRRGGLLVPVSGVDEAEGRDREQSR